MKDFRFEIAEPTISLNELKREYRNVHAFKREQERWDWMVAEKKRKMMGVSTEVPPAHITVTRFNNRLLDWDNMGGGLKFLFDAMVHNKILVDDSPKYVLSLTMKQEQVPRKDARTLVEIVFK